MSVSARLFCPSQAEIEHYRVSRVAMLNRERRMRRRSLLEMNGNHHLFQVIVSLSIALAMRIRCVHAERAYPLGCSQQPPNYYNYDSYPFPPPDSPTKSTDDYLLLRRLGAGKFSDVFEAVDVEAERAICAEPKEQVDPRTLVVLKCLKPVAERKIRRELLVLSHASKLPNLARLLGVVVPKSLPASERNSAVVAKLQPMPTLVLKHAGTQSQWLCHGRGTDPAARGGNKDQKQNQQYLSDYDIRYYLCHLLVALDALHARGIMHRDVKPRNVLINRNAKDDNSNPLMLIDLGLADFLLPNTRYNVRVASRHYKSPELLVGFEYYDYAIDMWGVGCILAGLLFRREPFFRGSVVICVYAMLLEHRIAMKSIKYLTGTRFATLCVNCTYRKDNVDQLGKIVSVLGTADIIAYISRYNIDLTPEVQRIINKYSSRGGNKRSWLSFLPKGCPIPSMEALDLLDKLLIYDHDSRFTAQQAMQHSFFDSVRERVRNEVWSQQTSGATNGTHAALQ